jgi:hypothetical protein
LTAALPGAASAGNSVISYTSTITRPLRIIDMQRRDSSGIDVPMFKMAREDYRSLTNKTASGSAVQWYYDPKRGTGVLYLWQPPADERNTYRFTAYVPLEAFTASTDDPDCPDEWVETLVYNLAVRLLPYWGSSVASDEKQIIIQTALALKQTLRGWDEDDAGISFQPMPNYAG